MGYRQPDEDTEGAAAQPAPPAPGGGTEPARIDSVSAQIRRQLRDEAGEPQDKGFDFQMRLRAGGNELNDTAQEFAGEAGEEYRPPEFSEGAWSAGESGGAGGALRWVVIGLAVAGVLVAGLIFGLPALKNFQMKQQQAQLDKQLAEHPPLEAVRLDDAFYTELDSALTAAGGALGTAGREAYIYRYRVVETLNAGVSQELAVDAMVGGTDASAAATAAQPALDSLKAWQAGIEAHPGVTVKFQFDPADKAGVPLDSDRYIRYGYDYGREHMSQLQPVLDALAARRQHDRVLDENITDPPLRTGGGFSFVARGFGYLPIYKTDGSGNIQMGTGGTLERMTPQEVTGYYLFLYLNDATAGMDFYSQSALEYYMHKIAPLPYDMGDERLHNVPLKPDGKPDGIGCVVKNGQLLRDGAR